MDFQGDRDVMLKRLRRYKNYDKWRIISIISALIAAIALLLTNSITIKAVNPIQPINESPEDGASNISLTWTLQGSTFNDSDDDDHTASWWQIREDATAANFSECVFDSGIDTTNKISLTIPIDTLKYNSKYQWRVRYQGGGEWSDWSDPTSFTTIGNFAPDQPANIFPANSATDISLTPTLTSSDFSDPDSNDTHSASHWQIREAGTAVDYSETVFDSGIDTTHETSIIVDEGCLSYGIAYYWHVMYQDSNGNWSVYSTETYFIPGSMIAPDNPENTSPANGVIDISLTPTMKSSSFSDSDTIDGHTDSQWQITMSSRYYSRLIYDSEIDTFNLNSIDVPPGMLDYDTTYYWHVRYRDGYDNWSEYSAETFFTTVTNSNPNQPSNSSPLVGATGISLTPTLTSSTFSDTDPNDTHSASQWQVTTTSGDYSIPVYDSDVDTSNKTSIIIPFGKLSYNTTYHWRVRYRDSYDNWSYWSTETSFITEIFKVDFSTSLTQADPFQTITFADLSSDNVNSWIWDFGDGFTVEWTNETRPDIGTIDHKYTAEGIYTVSLKVTSSTKTDTKSTTIAINKAPTPADNGGLPWVAIVMVVVVLFSGAGAIIWHRHSR